MHAKQPVSRIKENSRYRIWIWRGAWSKPALHDFPAQKNGKLEMRETGYVVLFKISIEQ